MNPIFESITGENMKIMTASTRHIMFGLVEFETTTVSSNQKHTLQGLKSMFCVLINY